MKIRISKIPQKKIAKPIEIANFIYELASERNTLFQIRFCLFRAVNKVMIKINKFFVLIISIFICVLLIEITLRVKGIGSNNIVYYSSNYYGYYQIPDQKITRRGNLISLDKYGNRNSKKYFGKFFFNFFG